MGKEEGLESKKEKPKDLCRGVVLAKNLQEARDLLSDTGFPLEGAVEERRICLGPKVSKTLETYLLDYLADREAQPSGIYTYGFPHESSNRAVTPESPLRDEWGRPRRSETGVRLAF